jgi:predicted HicB family RNase H-like nuclease
MGGEKLEHQVMVRLSSELHVEILAAANAEERTISGWIRVAMKEKLESRAAVVP